MVKTEMLSVKVSQQEKEKLKELAERLDISMSLLVREGIRLVLEKYSNKNNL